MFPGQQQPQQQHFSAGMAMRPMSAMSQPVASNNNSAAAAAVAAYHNSASNLFQQQQQQHSNNNGAAAVIGGGGGPAGMVPTPFTQTQVRKTISQT